MYAAGFVHVHVAGYFRVYLLHTACRISAPSPDDAPRVIQLHQVVVGLDRAVLLCTCSGVWVGGEGG
jgi:hypothetical protein